MTASISKTARIGDDLADQLGAASFTLGGDTFTTTYGYGPAVNRRTLGAGLQVLITFLDGEAKRPGLGSVNEYRNFALVVVADTQDETDRTACDTAMALADQIVRWLIVGDTTGQPRFADSDASCTEVKFVAGDQLAEHLQDLNCFHVPILATFRLTA